MFKELLRLHRSQNAPIPLEDFNTEVLAGILKMYPDILERFCADLLGLPDEKYSIYTQLRQNISGQDPNCIIDFVLEGEYSICFIENKIESSEGYRQLQRYITALRENHKDKKHYLCYCTLYSDPKEINELDLNFNQFRWYEVARFLEHYSSNPIVNNYLEFLKEKKMSQDNTLKTENLVAIENMRKSYEIAIFHIENSKAAFVNKFGIDRFDRNFHWNQLMLKNRLCYFSHGILECPDKKWSEVLYGIEFNTLRLVCQIYVDEGHQHYKDLEEITISSKFSREKFEGMGMAIQLSTDLGQFLNKENADKLVQEWFIESFDEIVRFIENAKHLNWSIPIK